MNTRRLCLFARARRNYAPHHAVAPRRKPQCAAAQSTSLAPFCKSSPLAVSLLLWLAATDTGWAQANIYTVLTYNTENTFDTIPSTDGHDDHEFLPHGTYHWTRSKYMRKLRHIAQVMMAADTAHPVDFALLQEVEGDTVLHDLLHKTKLASTPYSYFVTHSRDTRGMNVAFVYGTRRFFPLACETLRLADSTFRTRDILYVSGCAGRTDTLDFYVVHLPSRLGAAEAQAARRKLLAQLAVHVDSVVARRSSPHVIVAGDWNEEPDGKEILRFQRAEESDEPRLTNLMAAREGGSYKWHGRWEWIDQVMVSPTLRDGGRRVHLARRGGIRVLDLPLLMEEDRQWGGRKPFRAFRGPAWHGGYSDHLPVVLSLEISK